MAIYHLGLIIEPVGFVHDAGHYLLCCRYATGRCAFLGTDELRADGGLAEIEEAYRGYLGFSPWSWTEIQPADAEDEA